MPLFIWVSSLRTAGRVDPDRLKVVGAERTSPIQI
jgi:hypothetical protein